MKRILFLYGETIQAIAIILITALFLYAGAVKLIDVSAFQFQLSQSPLLPQGLVTSISYVVPLTEFVIVVMLFSSRLKTMGFYSSFFLMTIFTLYLITLVSIDENLPCSCGGILGKLSFKTHIFFNIFFVGLSLLGIYLQKNTQTEK